VPSLANVSLDDKYELDSGRVFVTGVQALVRLLILQRQRDRLAGLNTAASCPAIAARRSAASTSRCGRRRSSSTRRHQVPAGLNEDLAATAIWGSQQVNLYAGAKVDGVFAMWYGKGPASTAAATCSSTRTSRARRSTAACWCWPATTTRRKSSTLPHQSDHQFSRR
jgi:indolepyruvate ferredoxin oxidoreductase